MPQKQKLSLEEKVRIVKKYLVGESGMVFDIIGVVHSDCLFLC